METDMHRDERGADAWHNFLSGYRELLLILNSMPEEELLLEETTIKVIIATILSFFYCKYSLTLKILTKHNKYTEFHSKFNFE